MILLRSKLFYSFLVILFVLSQNAYVPPANAATVEEIDLRSSNYPNNYVEGGGYYDQLISYNHQLQATFC
ncbi:hypothetical protein JNUCC31_13640 [Paenibacillus sp. JNUCC31]|nr:hypothetical protein JNUCC31_13640 [Paenibacillus sp. JNUCC-31]